MAEQEQVASPHIDLAWLDLPSKWGIRSKIDPRRGLTLESINDGPYGDVPETATTRNGLMRGAAARPEAPRLAYWMPQRDDVYAYNLNALYEEALQRQWSSATDIPWETVKPLPDEVERAICKLCTFLAEVEFIAGDVPSQWLARISPEHFEVKAFLVTQVMDEARHLDAFRKRALMNGGGLMGQGGRGLRGFVANEDFVELTTALHIAAEGSILSVFRTGELIAQNEAEKRIFRLAAQDESRHAAFGVLHVKHVLETQPWRREEVNHYLDRGVRIFTSPQGGITANPATAEAQAFLLAGGNKNKIDVGYRKLMEIRRRQRREFLQRCNAAGLPERSQMITDEERRFLAHPIIT
ncbi:MAG: ferritin-like domain-containing protein [Myxococcota bacterium]